MTLSRARNVGVPLMNLIRTYGLPILKQLQLEEKLLRTSSENWCIINDGICDPTIVMGISGFVKAARFPEDVPGVMISNVLLILLHSRKPGELLEVTSVLRDNIPVIRRFTGGGTVIVDHGTIFVSFICNKDAVPGLQPYPQPIMAWSSILYDEVFHGAEDFKLRENDYVFGNQKFGGNAQSITKNRWIHHTSFLWDYEEVNMSYLKVPSRAPKYRLARDHSEFICRMKDILPRSSFIDRTIKAAQTQFTLRYIPRDEIESPATANFSPTSRYLTRQELEVAVHIQQSERLLSQPV